ncbi:MAG: phosphopyruvate hydratase [Candidatus Lokiarchaeota archaeon]|nr:phosphopyruvate hydratase [Candidatus Harpocratesius repetitus]
MNFEIKKIHARWIIDSRGNPTVECDMWAGDNVFVRAAVPSGASTGEAEAVELRDNDPSKFGGKGVLKAVENINSKISKIVIGMDCSNQKAIDQAMINADGTPNKGNFGANAILAVSMCAMKAAAKIQNKPLYQYVYELAHEGRTAERYLMPIPSSNVLNGGKHAGGDLAPQEFMIQAIGAPNFREAIRMTAEVYHTMKKVIKEQYGATSVNVGDEGGFAPALTTTREALDIIMESIKKAGYNPGSDIVLAMDPAASEFFDKEKQVYYIDGKTLKPSELVDYWVKIIDEYPIKSMEDPFDEEGWTEFAALKAKIGDRCQIIGDDLTVTNVQRLQKAIDMNAISSLLLKINQIGTITEAIDAAKLTFKNGYTVMVSHRSGETCDNTIADIVVGLCTGQIKSGAPCRADRLSKYNQLIRIEEELGEKAFYPKEYAEFKEFQ